MKVSIVTVVYNGEQYIEDCIQSVLAQNYPDIEYVVIDGGSKDSTVEKISKYADQIAHFVSEPDKGIYDAMNKGIRAATGDIVGILNADDFYSSHDAIAKVVETFLEKGVEATFADVRFIKENDKNKTIRYYSSAKWYPEKFARGYMPAHPTFFTYRKYFASYGLYRTDMRIAADYELLIRFLYKEKLTYAYINACLITMRLGGISTNGLKSLLLLNKEILQGCQINEVKTNYLKIYSKYFSKIIEYIYPRLSGSSGPRTP